jgi:hypothetical protein
MGFGTVRDVTLRGVLFQGLALGGSLRGHGNAFANLGLCTGARELAFKGRRSTCT